jgi:hypothetical protein
VLFDVATRTETLLPAPTPAYGAAASMPGSPVGPGSWSDFGADGVLDAGSTQWSPNCRLLVTYADGSTYQTSGTLISPRAVITSGHAVHQGPGGDWALSILVSPGWDGDDDLASSEYATLFQTFTAWLEDGELGGDQAYLSLSRPLGFLAGWYGYYFESDDGTLANEPFFGGAYPVAPCFEGAPDQLTGVSGTWDVVAEEALTASTFWNCWMGGMDGVGLHRNWFGLRQVGATLSAGTGTQSSTYGLLATRITDFKYTFLTDTYLPSLYVQGGYDLQPLKFRPPSPVIEHGDWALMSFQFCNVSLVDVDPYTYGLEVVLSADDVISADDLVLGTYNTAWDFSPLSTVKFNLNTWVPDSVAPGDYFVGVRITDAGAETVPGNNTTMGWDVGAVTIIDPDPWDDLGSALAGVTGDPVLSPSGVLTQGSANALDLTNAAPFANASLFVSLEESAVPFKGGVIKAFALPSPLILLTTQTDGAGDLLFGFTVTPDIPAGFDFYTQWVLPDAAAIKGFSMSNAVRGHTQ